MNAEIGIVPPSQIIHPCDSALHLTCHQCCRGSYPLQHHLQYRRVQSSLLLLHWECLSLDSQDMSGLSMVALSIESSWVETLSYPSSFYAMLRLWHYCMGMPYLLLLPAKHKFKGGPMMLIIWGPIVLGAPNFMTLDQLELILWPCLPPTNGACSHTGFHSGQVSCLYM